MNRYDVIIIGAGHNGLVAAAYLAKAGKKVLVLERRQITGGAATTEEVYPGFQYSPCAHTCELFNPKVIHELRLDRQGVQIDLLDPAVFALAQDGNHLALWRDKKEIVREIERVSKADATRYLRFLALVRKLASFVGFLHANPLPFAHGAKATRIPVLLRLALKLWNLGQQDLRQAAAIFSTSIFDFLNQWFESEILKAVMAASAISGTFSSPRFQGTAYLFLRHAVGSTHAFRSPSIVRGGIGRLCRTIQETAESYGAEIKVQSEVIEVPVTDFRARGVALKNGDEFLATVVVSGVDARNTFLKLLDPAHLDPDFILRVKNMKFRGACAKINLALDKLPDFRPQVGKRPACHRGLIQIGPSMDYIEKAFDDAKYGGFSKNPLLEILIPSATDPSLAPPGKHVMSVLMQFAPYRLSDGSWQEKREELGDLVVETIQEYAPGFQDSILHRQVLTPLDMEEIYSLTEGNGNHGELSLDQLFFMRPVPGWAWHRTPIKNLYLCGSSSHPGGGVTGLPGRNAAMQILRDWRTLCR